MSEDRERFFARLGELEQERIRASAEFARRFGVVVEDLDPGEYVIPVHVRREDPPAE